MSVASPTRVPHVDYLVLDEPPYLRATRCTTCGAAYFERRNACAACEGTTFTTTPVERVGEVITFTIVHLAAPSIPVPFVAAVIDCEGTRVSGNIVNTPPDADHIRLGMQVRLTTYPIGLDATGAEAIAFGFEPAGREEDTCD